MVELSSYTRTGCPIDRTTDRRRLAETNHLRLAQTAHGRLPPTYDEIVCLYPESTGGAPGEIGRGDRAAGREQGVGEDCGGVECAGRIAVMNGNPAVSAGGVSCHESRAFGRGWMDGWRAIFLSYNALDCCTILHASGAPFHTAWSFSPRRLILAHLTRTYPRACRSRRLGGRLLTADCAEAKSGREEVKNWH